MMESQMSLEMDAILYTMARRRGEEEQERRAEVNEDETQTGISSCSNSVSEAVIQPIPVTPVVSKSAGAPLKGILKVRFQQDACPSPNLEDRPPLQDFISQDSTVLLMEQSTHKRNSADSPTLTKHQVPLLLPQPAPPAPPPEIGLPPGEGPNPPSLFDSKIESNEYLSETAFKLYTNFLGELARFVEQQTEVVRNRLLVQEKRRLLRTLREEVSQCDVLLIDYIRRSVAKDVSSNDLGMLELFEAAQAARDRVGPVESEYELLEVQLGADEDALKQKYDDVSHRFEHFFKLKLNDSSIKPKAPSEIEYETESDSSVGDWTGQEIAYTDLLHGNVVGEQVLIGQLPMAASKRRVERSISPMRFPGPGRRLSQQSDAGDAPRDHPSADSNNEDFHDEYHQDLLGMSGAGQVGMAQPHGFEEEDQKVSSEESLKGLVAFNLFESFEDPGPLPEDLTTNVKLEEGESLLLFEDDKSTLEALQWYIMVFESTPDRVNKWILHQLRLSRRETFTLRNQIAFLMPEASNWASTALQEWFNDDLGYDQPYYHGSIEGGTDEKDEQITEQILDTETPMIHSISASRHHPPESTTVLPADESDVYDTSTIQ